MVGPARPEAWRNFVPRAMFYCLSISAWMSLSRFASSIVCTDGATFCAARTSQLIRAVRSHREHPSARIQVVRSVSRSYLNV